MKKTASEAKVTKRPVSKGLKVWAITLGKTRSINAFRITQYGVEKHILAIFRKKSDAEWCAQGHNDVIPLYTKGGK